MCDSVDWSALSGHWCLAASIGFEWYLIVVVWLDVPVVCTVESGYLALDDYSTLLDPICIGGIAGTWSVSEVCSDVDAAAVTNDATVSGVTN